MDGSSSALQFFESLRNLYRQSSDLLLDSDRLLGEKGWQPVNSNGPGEYSYSISVPDKWFARWASRFYYPASAEDETSIEALLFSSVHFASDEGDTEVDEPLFAGGYLRFAPALTKREALGQWRNSYWVCKSWSYGEPFDREGQWVEWQVPSRYMAAMPVVRSVTLPLYSIDSPEALREKAIETLLQGLHQDG